MTTTDAPHRVLTALDDDECMRLLKAHRVGRMGLSCDSLPVVLPVNYVVDRDRVVVCTTPGAKLTSARHGVVACLEVDAFDVVEQTGWSVMVTGRLRELTAEADLATVRDLRLRPWTSMADPHFLTLSTELVTGRRLQRPES
jgi:nitroimidazol reductase NimA-like FMN-containing flavoprotein (pyridoxamine 5'-phosphate oxidase superfamily)